MKPQGLRQTRRAALRHVFAAFAVVIGLATSTAVRSAEAFDTLRVLAWPGYADPDLVNVFEQRHKVKVQVTVVSSDENMWDRVNTVDSTESNDRKNKIIWLEPVEDAARRSSIWARITSGDRLVALDLP